LGLALIAGSLPSAPVAKRVSIGAGWGLAQYGIGIAWSVQFSGYGFVALLAVCAAYTCLTAVAVPTRSNWNVAVGFPVAVMLGEWARDRFPLHGFPLGSLGLGQAAGPLEWSARIGGGLLLSGETALVGVVIAFAATAVSHRLAATSAPALQRLGLALATALCVAVPAAGWFSPRGAGANPKTLSVALVQGGGPLGTRAIHTDPQVVFDRQMSESRSLHGPVDLVVWPEGILEANSPFQSGVDASQVASLARRLSATVLVGIVQNLGQADYLNEVAAWSPKGQVVATYVKNHLVPFGEYIPARSFLSRYFNLADVPRDAVPGHSPAFMRTPAAPLGVLISYEVFFGARARSGVRAGGEVLVVPTDDASYRGTQVVGQELAAARLRALETGRWLVLVSPTGYSEVVRPDGVVEDRTPLRLPAVVETTVGLRNGRTWFVDLGDKPFVAAAALLWIVAAVGSGSAARWLVSRRLQPLASRALGDPEANRSREGSQAEGAAR
jgi:apolipoprotein N-acyltransferase